MENYTNNIKKSAINCAAYNISDDHFSKNHRSVSKSLAPQIIPENLSFQTVGLFYNFANNSFWFLRDCTRNMGHSNDVKTERTKTRYLPTISGCNENHSAQCMYPLEEIDHSSHTTISRHIDAYRKKIWSAYQGRESDRLISETVTKNSPPLSQTSEWEGYVETIEGDNFYAKLVDITSNSVFPEKEEWFSVRDLRESQRRKLEEGSIIRLVIGTRQLPGGQSQRVYELSIVEAPMHTKENISLAVKKAKRLLDSLNVKDDASQ